MCKFDRQQVYLSDKQQRYFLSPYSTGNWLPNANEIDTMYVPDARNLRLVPNATYIPLACVWVSHRVKRNFYVSRRVKRKKIASPNAKYTKMLVYFALGNAKFWRRVHCPTPNPDGRYFVSQWNIGFKIDRRHGALVTW